MLAYGGKNIPFIDNFLGLSTVRPLEIKHDFIIQPWLSIEYVKDFSASLAGGNLMYDFVIPCHVKAIATSWLQL
jgi:hypothetical protein